MRKLSVKISVILSAILITIIAAISTLVFLINSGKLTHFIERRIKTNTSFDIKIKDIHLDIFSDLQLRQISVKGLSDQNQFTLECNTISIHYKPFDLLKQRIKGIDISDMQIKLNTESDKTTGHPSSQDDEAPPVNIKDFYPERLFIEAVSINNTNMRITLDSYIFTLTKINMHAKGIQSAKPFDISLAGNFSILNRMHDNPSTLPGKIDINTKYSLPDDELTILGSSYVLVNDLSKFSINGKAHSILSLPEINCNINCKSLSKVLKSIIPEKFKDWSLNGNISINTVINYTCKDKPQKMTAVTDLSFSKLKFASPDYDHFAEGINGWLKVSMSTDSDFSKFSFNTNGTFGPFLIQLGKFTTDMRSRRTYIYINGNYDSDKKQITEMEGAFSWDNLGTLTALGDILDLADNPHIDMNIVLEKIDNAAFLETFIKDTVKYSNPLLFNTHIEGESNLRFYIKGDKKDFFINGHLNGKNLSLIYGDISIENASIDLPVSMAYPRSKTLIRKQDISETQYGTVQLKKLSFGPLEIEDIRTNPILISNNFFIKGPFRVDVFDGTLDIRNISVENVINSDREIKLEFQLNNINLKDMTATYKLTPFEGTLSSAVMSFQQQGQRLFSKEEISIELFGGDITISNLTLNNFLTSMREIGFSAEVKHLDLGQMSNTYREWGSITGIINGQITDFKLVAREPSSFEIEVRTERYKKTKQTVSAKFLKNFVPGIGKVLDKVGFTNYKYAVMGVHARLENDYIKLRGAVREDGKELFMKGAGMKRLEIVFPNVDRRVPFKTFLNSFKGMLDSDFKDTKVQFK